MLIRKKLFDKKAKNLLQVVLSMDEFFRITKKIWDTLEITHERNVEMKRLKLNTLSQEYEIFRMKFEESILDLQKKISNLTNHLAAIGSKFSNDELGLKFFRSLTRA